MRHATILALALACLASAPIRAAAESSGCLPRVSLPLTVHIGDAVRVAAWLEGGFETPLRLLEAASGRVLWTAGAHASATQRFPGLDAGFAGSLAVIDLDGDGLHDRLYAGDMAGRLWRFDFHHGADAAAWASGGVFADFSNTEGRGFLAAPDISLSAPPGHRPWLNIAIGTAAPGNPSASNHLYALRDYAVRETWSAEDYERRHPLRESDLSRVEVPARTAVEVSPPPEGAAGWYVELGYGHVVAPALTVNGRAVLAVVAAVPSGGGSCEVFAHIVSLDLQRQQVVAGTTGDSSTWRIPLAEVVPIPARFILVPTAGTTFNCMLAGQRVTACDVDTRPRTTWWRRADAE